MKISHKKFKNIKFYSQKKHFHSSKRINGASTNTKNYHHGYPTPGTQRPTGQKVMNNVFFLTETEWKHTREEESFDYIVVGSGFCGLAFVDRIYKNDPNSRILMLERGPFFLPEHFQNLPLPFVNTLGGLSETFPWTLTRKTDMGEKIRWNHGMVPFFGGRSTLWSAWCPRPNRDELEGWPRETVDVLQKYFSSAEKLLQVKSADDIDENDNQTKLDILRKKRPVYDQLQKKMMKLLKEKYQSLPEKSIYRVEAAPLACSARDINGIDFQKFSTPDSILRIALDKHKLDGKSNSRFKIAAECVVEKIIQQDNTAIALQTSRGIMPINNAKLILAMGSLPPTTLIHNSFPGVPNVGKRFSSHFISAVVARVPKKDIDPNCEFGELEIGASYVAGIGKNYNQQFHIQLSALHVRNPERDSGIALRYMPDVVATASPEQLKDSRDHVVFVFAVLGELDHNNPENYFLPNPQDTDITTNSLLQVTTNENDDNCWNVMDKSTFSVLELALSPNGPDNVEYWHDSPSGGSWKKARPTNIKVDSMVHESSTLYIGSEYNAPVDLNYKLRTTENVYITGGGLWPRGGSWNPTMTMVGLTQHLADLLSNPTKN